MEKPQNNPWEIMEPAKINYPSSDRISQLPDEVLLDILSLLTIKEAGRSSLFSSRWRNLWKFVINLNFDDPEFSCATDSEVKTFVAWVDQVLDKYEGSSLNEFRIKFNYDSSCSNNVDKWIQFVVPKRVKKLEIELNAYMHDLYTLSAECSLCFMNPLNLDSLKCLTSLTLKSVSINDELAGYILLNCGRLESLRIFFSYQLINLKVTEQSVNLKHMELFRCDLMESFEISAPNLVSLKYFGRRIKYKIGNLPHLVELYFGGRHGDQVIYVLRPFSCYLSQVHTLELKMFLENNNELLKLPELTNLKLLTLAIAFNKGETLHRFNSLVEAAPSLHTLILEMRSPFRPVSQKRKTYNKIHPHHGLKFVEFYGYFGGRAELEMAHYLLKNAVNLETITIYPYYKSQREITDEKQEVACGRQHARELEKLLPPRARLIVM